VKPDDYEAFLAKEILGEKTQKVKVSILTNMIW